jgi:hypothetical protein
MGAIHTNPDHTGGPPVPEANPFHEDPCAFRAAKHQIIRPFDADFRRT